MSMCCDFRFSSKNLKTFFPGLLRAAAECLKREDILLQIRGYDLVAIEAHYHEKCHSELTTEYQNQLVHGEGTR